MEDLGPFSTLHKIHKIPLIPTSMHLIKHPKSIGLSLLPLSQIRIPFLILPHACPMFQVIHPFSLIHLPVPPCILSLALHLAVFVAALIDAAICEFLVSLSRPHIIFPLALVGLAAIVDHDPYALTLVIHELTVVYRFFVLLESEMRRTMQDCHIDLARGVCLEVLQQFFVGISVAVSGGHE